MCIIFWRNGKSAGCFPRPAEGGSVGKVSREPGTVSAGRGGMGAGVRHVQKTVGLRMVFDGICLLPETLQPSPAAFAKWIVIADAIEEFSGRMNAALKDLTGLFVNEGLRPVLQKGQGVAALYPDPSHRECGDIDFYFPERQPLRQAPRPGRITSSGR